MNHVDIDRRQGSHLVSKRHSPRLSTVLPGYQGKISSSLCKSFHVDSSHVFGLKFGRSTTGHRSCSNRVRLVLSLLAYNLGIPRW